MQLKKRFIIAKRSFSTLKSFINFIKILENISKFDILSPVIKTLLTRPKLCVAIPYQLFIFKAVEFL